MKTLFLDCGMGAAGDMLAAALIELLPDKESFIKRLNALGIPSVSFSLKKEEKCGVWGSRFTVSVNGEIEGENEHEHAHDHGHSHEHAHDHAHEHGHGHRHNGMSEIENVVDSLDLKKDIKADILSVYALIAEAESEVHAKTVDEIHFHEVGDKDAIADITAVCMLFNEIAPDEVVVSPIATGYGEVKCAHGLLPVPAPATAIILKGVPVYAGRIEGELCTPTGAALLKRFATRFCEMPEMIPYAVGYGMGKKNFERANCVRAILGESETNGKDGIIELSANVDDMTAEEIAFSCERLFEAGAKEVFTYPVQMKKSRYGSVITVFCDEKNENELVGAFFKHTSTIGVRKQRYDRFILNRKIEKVETPYGAVRKKVSSGYGEKKEKFEYDDVAKIAKELGVSYREALELIKNGEYGG